MTDEVEYTIEETVGKRVARARFTQSGREKNVLEDLQALLTTGTLPPEDKPDLDEGEEGEVPDQTIPRAVMTVDKVEGVRGETIAVQIRGGCADPVMGYQLAMGYGRWLEVVRIELGPFFVAYAGNNLWASPEDVKGGWPEPFVRIALAFFNLDPSAPKGIGGILDPVPIPPGTVLATIHFKIPDAPGSTEQMLFMKRLWFKEKSTDHSLLKVDCMYPRWRKPGKIPITVSGKLTVTDAVATAAKP